MCIIFCFPVISLNTTETKRHFRTAHRLLSGTHRQISFSRNFAGKIIIMLASTKLNLWVVTGLLAVTTVFFNVYMFLMSLSSFRQKKQCPTDTIIMALSLAVVTHQLVCYFFMTMEEMDSACNVSSMFYIVVLLLIFSLKFIIMWDTSFLAFYYSTKLVSAHHHCYTQIQAAILKHVTTAVLVITLCGLGSSLPMLVVFCDGNSTSVEDCGVMLPETYSSQVFVGIYLMVSDILPGLFMVKCCISISVHLIIHLRHMKSSTNGAHAPKLGSEMRVVRMALSLVAVFAVFLVVDLYVHYQITVKRENDIVLTFVFTSVYTTVAAVVLIYGKKTLWKTLLHDLNVCLDAYPCLSRLKVPEHKAKHDSPARVGK